MNIFSHSQEQPCLEPVFLDRGIRTRENRY